MPRKKKPVTSQVAARKPARDISTWTKPRQFRLSDETLEELDKIAEHLTSKTGVTHSRTDAIRYASRQTATTLGVG